ncbi:MAG TPA: glycosyltransferase family 2 protein [Vicinamibacterales bacterium]|nr:glycosyltransferase family 2 protein [Vicinamibacterales bacterium]
MPALISIIVPVYNEEQTVVPLLEQLLGISMPADREVLVVNDGSTDGTETGLNELGRRQGLRVLHATTNAGKGSAIRVGLAYAAGEIIAIQDADLELDPADLPRLVEPILKGDAEVVYGSRFLGGRPAAPWKTIVANRVLTTLTNILFGSRLTDMETCYKIMRTDVARSLDLQCHRFDIEPEITAKLLLAGHAIIERPVAFNPRTRAAGKKIDWRDGVRAIDVLLRCRIGQPVGRATDGLPSVSEPTRH